MNGHNSNIVTTFDSVWDALEDGPTEAANMRLRSELLIAIQATVAEWAGAPAEVARRLDLTRPRLDDLLRGRIENFTLDALAVIAARAGLTVRIDVVAAAAA